MPIIAFFSRTPKTAKPFQDATKVTVNGKVVHGAWFFEQSTYIKGYPVEAHYRLEHYWPAHSHVHVDLPMKGVSAGGNLAYNDSLTLDFTIGASHVLTVSNATHHVTAVFDGHKAGSYPVSLGAPQTPTRRGTKVIMEKVKTVCMHNVQNTYYECGIKWDQRLTYDGEYLHSAPWNIANIDSGVNSSNGCTNLLPNDAVKLYHQLEVGDVVQYPDATGKRMQLGDGYGDWNIPWSTWQAGGAVRSG
jgi:lipoprotein-anchoring transpeptidase ErfK/SrfK